MRITSMMTAQMTLAGIEQANEGLVTTEQQISSGLRINKPSDDPYGAGLAMRLKGQAGQLNSYNTAVSDATAWSQTTSSTLTSVGDIVQRIRELVVQSASGTVNQQDRNAAAQEVSQLLDSVKQYANATYDGQYIFAGTATGTAPYQAGATDTYQGNGAAINRQIGPGTTVQVNTDISQLLGNGPSAADGRLLDTVRTVINDIQSGNQAALTNGDLGKLDSNLGTLQSMQVDVGALQERLQQASSRIQDMQTTNAQLLSSTEDVDIAQAMTSYTTEQAAYTAALQAGASILQTDSLMNFLR
jgi:flagellar hook-associated protein 3 FlgL